MVIQVSDKSVVKEDCNFSNFGTEAFLVSWVVSKTKTEARSTQISKRKHPKLENEAPKFRKRSTQNSKTKHPELENEAPKTQKRSTQISKPL